MPAKKQSGKPHPRSAQAAEKKFGKAARRSAEAGGKKPIAWQQAEKPTKRLPGSVPLAPPVDLFEPVAKTFESSVSHSIEASTSDVYRAFNDPNRRSWCHERAYTVRGSVAPRSLILRFADGTSASVAISRKGNARSLVMVLHKGIATAANAEIARNQWRASLERLAATMAD